MSRAFVIILLVIAGSFVSMQASINARLAKYVGFLESAFISFLVGTITLLIIIIFRGQNNLKNIIDVPPLFLTGGILGALFVFIITYSIHIIGVANAFAITISVQLLIGLLLDRFDPLKVVKLNITVTNLLGVLFIIIGVILVSWRK